LGRWALCCALALNCAEGPALGAQWRG
jgi:hypothetical protein